MSRTSASGGEHGRRALLAGLSVLLIAAIALGAFLRIHTAFADPSFDMHSAKGLLRSDPGLLYYVADRIVESGGARQK